MDDPAVAALAAAQVEEQMRAFRESQARSDVALNIASEVQRQMDAFRLPQEPTVTTGTTTSSIVSPLVGGTQNGVPWTGGEPKTTDRKQGSKNPRPYTPFCFRPTSASESLKVYEKQTRVSSDSTLFSRTDPLAVFEQTVMSHLTNTGMDSIIWVKSPYGDNDELVVNIVTHHSAITCTQVIDYFEAGMKVQLFDDYDVSNMRAFKDWLLAKLDDHLRARIFAKLTKESTGPEAWMYLVGEVCTESYPYFETLKAKVKGLKVADYAGKNVKEFTAAWSLVAQELETANAFEDAMIVNLVTALTKSNVEIFRIMRMTQTLADVRFLAKEARRKLPGDKVVTHRKITLEADSLYQELHEDGNWTAAESERDSQASQANVVKKQNEAEAHIYALVLNGIQKAFQPGPGGDLSHITCFNCGDAGHFATNCPKANSSEAKTPVKADVAPRNDVNPWKTISPKAGHPQTVKHKTPLASYKATPPVRGKRTLNQLEAASHSVR
jgi:hypothetical protein